MAESCLVPKNKIGKRCNITLFFKNMTWSHKRDLIASMTNKKNEKGDLKTTKSLEH
jgi:hypothetical protein